MRDPMTLAPWINWYRGFLQPYGAIKAEAPAPSASPAADPIDQVRWAWLRDTLKRDPMWLFRRGMFLVSLLLALAAALMVFTPLVGIAVVASTVGLWGLVVLADVALRGESFQDPRFATLLLLIGVGSLLVILSRRL